jgi:hypothetical protein
MRMNCCSRKGNAMVAAFRVVAIVSAFCGLAWLFVSSVPVFWADAHVKLRPEVLMKQRTGLRSR